MWGSRYKAGQTHNPPLFHKIDTWNFGVNDVNDYFEVKRPTSVVIAPGSDMPYCLVHWVDPGAVPAAGDGWPAQAANPAAYVSLLEPNQDSDEATWHPILISNVPVTLMPGFYVPALPQMAYAGDQFDIEHAWPTTMFEYPEVILMESNFPVEMCPYQFTTKEVVETDTSYYMPWLICPTGAGLVASISNFTWSKAIGFGASNNTGGAMTGQCRFDFLTKDRTWPDGAAVRNYQDLATIPILTSGSRSNQLAERFGWMKPMAFVCAVGTIPAGVGIICF
jgi:hypothetical protein